MFLYLNQQNWLDWIESYRHMIMGPIIYLLIRKIVHEM